MAQRGRTHMMSTLIFSVGLIISAAFLGHHISRSAYLFRPSSKGIQVRGVAETTVMADKAGLTLRVSVNGPTVKAVKERAYWAETALHNFLRDQGLQPGEWRVDLSHTPHLTYMGQNEAQTESHKRYSMSFCIRLVSGKRSMEFLETIADRAPHIMKDEELVSCSSEMDYDYSHFVQERPNLIRQAAEDARTAASLLAKDMNVTLGRVESISQGMVEMSGHRQKTLRVVLQTAWAIS